MATPFIVGCSVAAVAYGARAALPVVQQLRSNPEVARQLGAAAAGFRGMGNAFQPTMLLRMMGRDTGGGFDAAMSRGEASKILEVSERGTKQQIKDAHRKMMMLNHPDRGGSPYIASKINEAAECLQGQSKSSGSAFS